MANAKELIGDILSNPRVAQSRVLSSRVYEDEPLLFTGSQMRNFLPAKYQEMRKLAAPTVVKGIYRRPTETKLFVKQAQFMRNWEDDYPYKGSFKRYYPTYSAMNDQQLRGYFTWRTKVRAGHIEDTSLSFAYVYVYELLNGVGAGTPQGCFNKMFRFWKEFRKVNSGLDAYLPAWLRDFVVYHDLPADLFEQLVDLSFENALITLRAYERNCVADGSWVPSEDDRKNLWDALGVLSFYDIETSKVLREDEDVAERVAALAIARLAVHYAKKRKKGLAESWFGSPQVTEHFMFPSAVFYEEHKHPDCRFDVNEVHSYSCKDGNWYALRRYKKPLPSSDLGDLMRAIEYFLFAGDAAPSGDANLKLPKYQVSLVGECVREVRNHIAEQEKRRVVIDRSSLAGIRERAAGTREQLLTDDERAESAAEDSVDSASQGEGLASVEPGSSAKESCSMESSTPDSEDSSVPGSATKAAVLNPEAPDAYDAATGAATLKFEVSNEPSGEPSKNALTGLGATSPTKDGPSSQGCDQGANLLDLTEEELSFLDSLLQGAQPSEDADEDLLVDSVNEKLFDLLGDTALEFGDFGPQVIDEYTQELEKVVSAWKSR